MALLINKSHGNIHKCFVLVVVICSHVHETSVLFSCREVKSSTKLWSSKTCTDQKLGFQRKSRINWIKTINCQHKAVSYQFVDTIFSNTFEYYTVIFHLWMTQRTLKYSTRKWHNKSFSVLSFSFSYKKKRLVDLSCGKIINLISHVNLPRLFFCIQ